MKEPQHIYNVFSTSAMNPPCIKTIGQSGCDHATGQVAIQKAGKMPLASCLALVKAVQVTSGISLCIIQRLRIGFCQHGKLASGICAVTSFHSKKRNFSISESIGLSMFF